MLLCGIWGGKSIERWTVGRKEIVKRECCRRLVAAPTGKGGGWAWRVSGKGRRGRRPLRWDRTVFACFQSSRRDTIMRQGAIHAEGNSWQSQFMPVRAIHCPSAVMPPPAGCRVRNRKCLTTPPAFCLGKKPPPLTRGGMGALRTRRKKGKCGAMGGGCGRAIRESPLR